MAHNPKVSRAYAIDYDLINCNKEPIHFIRLVQEHACLLAISWQIVKSYISAIIQCVFLVKTQKRCPFNQLVSADDYEGFGVIMAIANYIVIQHQGKTWVESQKGIGSNFYFELPAQLDILVPDNENELN